MPQVPTDTTDTAQMTEVLVLGGGAAGLMCAAIAAARGRTVTVLEGSNRCGKKILMSGGGRCNFTNVHSTPANFLSANPHFCKSALARYTPADFIASAPLPNWLAWVSRSKLPATRACSTPACCSPIAA